MFAAASTLFGKSSSLAAYNLHTSPSPTPSSSGLPSRAASPSTPKTLNIGLWKVVEASHKTTGKNVSVWIFEKKVLDAVRGDSMGMSPAQAKDWVLNQLKKEVGTFYDI